LNCRYSPKFVKEYVEESKPMFSVGEYWDSCEYTDGTLNYNQGEKNIQYSVLVIVVSKEIAELAM
jgi:hypothetical protein